MAFSTPAPLITTWQLRRLGPLDDQALGVSLNDLPLSWYRLAASVNDQSHRPVVQPRRAHLTPKAIGGRQETAHLERWHACPEISADRGGTPGLFSARTTLATPSRGQSAVRCPSSLLGRSLREIVLRGSSQHRRPHRVISSRLPRAGVNPALTRGRCEQV